jgi:predicted AAA+ superfamily ATPase
MENFIKLNFINELQTNLRADRGLLQVILGPRQVGKTTSILNLLESEYKDSHIYLSLDSVFNTQHTLIRESWDQARRGKKLLVIDEIQKCHNWAETIKSLWDEGKRVKDLPRCVLLGSSSLSIQRGLTESLTGRFQLLTAFHWNFHESRSGYGLNFDEYLKFGGYPGSYLFRGTMQWKQYVAVSIISTVIERDILQYQSVKNPALFKQAFEIIMAYPAMEISYTKLLGQLQNKGNVEIIKHYLNLYQGAYLVKVLERYAPSQIKVKSSSPKILPLAPCLYYLTHLDEYSPDERGRVFEALVGAQLVRTGEDLFYWRERLDEVDFVVRRGKSLWAVEVKSGRRRPEGGLQAFAKKFPKARLVLITPDNYPAFESDPMGFLES